MHLVDKHLRSTHHVPGSEGPSETKESQCWCPGSSQPGGQDHQGTGRGHMGASRDEHRSGVMAAVEDSKKFLVCPENEFE